MRTRLGEDTGIVETKDSHGTVEERGHREAKLMKSDLRRPRRKYQKTSAAGDGDWSRQGLSYAGYNTLPFSWSTQRIFSVGKRSQT